MAVTAESALPLVRSALPNDGNGLDDAVVEYIAQLVSDDSMSDEDLREGVAPLLSDAGLDENDIPSIIDRIVMALHGKGTQTKAAAEDTPLKLLDAPVIMLEKVREYEQAAARRIKIELNLKEDLFTNPLIPTFEDPNASTELSEAAMKQKAKMEKKLEKQEKRGINRERTAASDRNEFLARLTKAPVVLHNKGEFGELLASSGGAVDIHLDGVTMEVGGLVMLEDANVTLSYGRRYGLIGRNGVGKTTFLKHIAGKVFPGIPNHLQILHIEQEVHGGEVSVLQTVLNCDIEREALLREEKNIVDEDNERQKNGLLPLEDKGLRLNEIYRRLDEIDASSAPARAAAILSGLGFTTEMQQRPTQEFSGGWRMRVSLALALFIQPDVLLLDEPTNHLDLHAVLWLEDYLIKWKKTLIVVSHARDFLNNVVTDILHMQNKKIVRFKGDYYNFEERRAEVSKQTEKQIENQEAHRAHVQRFIDRFRVSAARAAMVQSRIKALERLEKVAPVFVDPEIQFNFPNPEPVSGQAHIQLIDVSFGYEGRPELFSGVDLTIKPDSRIGLVGPNGAGKSTLLKLIFNEIQPTRGVCNVSNKLRIERFSQHHVDQLNLKKSALETFKTDYPSDPIQKIRAHLGSLGITGKLALQPIYTLSGGQKSRVALAKITYSRPHILLLDEPTNHLDLDTVQALIDGLTQFEGGVFVISHDEHLITAVCNELWVLDSGKVRIWDGDFEDYKKVVKKKF